MLTTEENSGIPLMTSNSFNGSSHFTNRFIFYHIMGILSTVRQTKTGPAIWITSLKTTGDTCIIQIKRRRISQVDRRL